MKDRTGKTIGAAPRPGSSVGTIVFILAGPIVWALHFTALYFTQSVACQIASENLTASTAATINIVIWISTLLAVGLLAAVMFYPARVEQILHTDVWSSAQRTFHRMTMATLAALSLFAIIAGASGTLFIDTCAALR